jgi:hypothetical protein
MLNAKHLFALALLSTLAPAARAAENKELRFYCPDIQRIANGVESCDDNARVSDAGIECIEKFESLVKARGVVLNAASTLLKTANSQRGELGNTKTEYKMSEATLRSLIEAGKKAQEVVGKYQNLVVFPEDFDAPDEITGDKEEFLAGNQCYAEPSKILKDVAKDLAHYVKDLETALAANRALEQRTDFSTKSLVQEHEATIPTGQAPAGAKVKVDYGPEKKRGMSDISGTEDKPKK